MNSSSISTKGAGAQVLVFRLSSLGDVILSTAALNALTDPSTEVDWVVSREFSFLLEGHPRIRRLWVYDRSTGLGGWIQLCRQLWVQRYTSVLDLHSSLRTRLARLFFWTWRVGLSGTRASSASKISWQTISKQRFRLFGYFLFKGIWPWAWRPTPMVRRFSLLAGGNGRERPDLRHLVQAACSFDSPHLCVMPSSRWQAKCWSAEKYCEILSALPLLPVIMGTEKDEESRKLVTLLEGRGIRHVSGLGKWNIRKCAEVLASAQGYLGSDTGLAHLAEAMGVPAWIVFGPTVPDMGFGPWRPESGALGRDLWCSPCGKDGRYCFRFDRRYTCLRDFAVTEALAQLQGFLVAASAQGDNKGSGRLGSKAVQVRDIRLSAYRWFQRRVVGRWVLPRFFSAERLASAPPATGRLQQDFSGPRAWFHAASAGELETLVSVIQAWTAGGGDLILTVFSESARPQLERLRKQITGLKGRLIFSGFSPWEGSWASVLDWGKPEIFVTAKYEAWPDLWLSLSERGIPLMIVGAQDRSSLRWCKRLCSLLAGGGALPDMELITVHEAQVAGLGALFPGGRVRALGEPRWDQIASRAQQGNVRARALARAFEKLPRPWGILGQVWPEDLEVWKGLLSRTKGTLWVVPHRIDEERVASLETRLRAEGFSLIRTSRFPGEQPEIPAIDAFQRGDAPVCVLVDEIGFLLELYNVGDWVFVGGGFRSAGVHSTMEPAFYGLPVACGPEGTHKFPEISELSGTGQLRVIHNRSQLEAWLDELSSLGRNREAWSQQARARLGATRKIHLQIQSQLAGLERSSRVMIEEQESTKPF